MNSMQKPRNWCIVCARSDFGRGFGFCVDMDERRCYEAASDGANNYRSGLQMADVPLLDIRALPNLPMYPLTDTWADPDSSTRPGRVETLERKNELVYWYWKEERH